MAEGYRNFDEARKESEGRTTKFTFKGEDFEVDLNVDAFVLLDWMEVANKAEGIPLFLKVFFNEEDRARLRDTKPKWNELEPLMVWLSQELGGSGN